MKSKTILVLHGEKGPVLNLFSTGLSLILTQTVDALAQSCRRRTHIAAIVVGELLRSIDPAVSEWGNPTNFTVGYSHPKLYPFRVFISCVEGTVRTETSK